mmetsp:Transcript_68491/g.101737  ORF Transcript_68491/g.101737 Transcript_68491/m.101737 type:complete len:98 (-) Transcript_68491:661-954(-)
MFHVIFMLPFFHPKQILNAALTPTLFLFQERQVFENDARYTPAEKASAIEIRDTKLALYRTLFAALKKHESGEETLSDEVFADYTKQMDELKVREHS